MSVMSAQGYVVDGVDYMKEYPIPDSMKHMLDKIERLGTKHYKVLLKPSWCYKDVGCHKYIVKGWELFASFGDVSTCHCFECVKSGELSKASRRIGF